MKLLVEDALIAESVKANGKWKIKGCYMESETKNRNGRIYPKEILDNEVNRYIKEMVEKNRALSELSHPATPQINYQFVCGKITELTLQGNQWHGVCEILDTPNGKIVSALLEGGVQLGMSSRALGSLKENNGVNYVSDDLRLAAVDVVSEPSCGSAYVQGIMESAEWIFDVGTQSFIREDLISKHRSFVKKNYKTLTESQKLGMFQSFIQTF